LPADEQAAFICDRDRWLASSLILSRLKMLWKNAMNQPGNFAWPRMVAGTVHSKKTPCEFFDQGKKPDVLGDEVSPLSTRLEQPR
jgi:hypothetical protein